MKIKLGAVCSVAVGLLMAAGSLWAHHSYAVYDMARLKIVKGTVTTHQFNNSHQIIRMKERDDDGKVTPWILVGAAVSANRAAGWNKDTLKTGEAITVYGFTYRDGRPNMTWMRIIKDNGNMLPISGTKNSKLGRCLRTYGKDPLSKEDYEIFEKSMTYIGTGDPNQR